MGTLSHTRGRAVIAIPGGVPRSMEHCVPRGATLPDNKAFEDDGNEPGVTIRQGKLTELQTTEAAHLASGMAVGGS